MQMDFQVADVKKPLIEVKRIVENGNRVFFGPGDEETFFYNESSGNKLALRVDVRWCGVWCK